MLRRDFEDFMAAFEELRSVEALIDAYLQALRGSVMGDRPSCWAVISIRAQGWDAAPEAAALINEARREQHDFARSCGADVAHADDPDAFAARFG